jgi:hypothetical protein
MGCTDKINGLTNYHKHAKGDKVISSDFKQTKVYKIQYTINILPSVTYDGDEGATRNNKFLTLLGETDELEVFNCKVIKDIL